MTAMTRPGIPPDRLSTVTATDNDQQRSVQNPKIAAKSPPPRVKEHALAGFSAAC